MPLGAHPEPFITPLPANSMRQIITSSWSTCAADVGVSGCDHAPAHVSIPMLSQPWSDWVSGRGERVRQAESIAKELSAGRSAPLPGWCFGGASLDRAGQMILQAAPTLVGMCGRLSLDPASCQADRVALPWQHAELLDDVVVEPTDANALAAAVVHVLDLGERLHELERQAWADQTYRAHRHDDDVRRMWSAWTRGEPWMIRDRWEELYLPVAERVFRAIAEARRLPDDVRRRAIADLRDGFFYSLLGDRGGLPGWASLAVRTIETMGAGGPVLAVSRNLTAVELDKLSRCAAHRGSWASTVQGLFPLRAEPEARGRALTNRLSDDPRQLDAMVDLHVLARVLRRWQERGPNGTWAVAAQNRGRARGRLRALLAGADPRHLSSVLSTIDAPHARTIVALRRYAWAWAWRELASDFSFDLGHAATSPCLVAQRPHAPLTTDQRRALRTWVLLVCLRGRLGHLVRWVQSGGTGDRDSTWARLLADASPPDLRDPACEGQRRSTYHRLRTELTEEVLPMVARLREVVHRVAEQPLGRTLRARITAEIEPVWHPLVPMPRSGFPGFVRSAADVLRTLDALLEDPCTP